VIELPLADELDVNGWDLVKALRLLMKGNAVIIEWLTSPLVYRGDEAFRSSFLALTRAVADRDLVMRHYLHLGEELRRRHLSDPAAVPLKKLFYALRPAAAIRWLAQHPDAAAARRRGSHRHRSPGAQGYDTRARHRPASAALGRFHPWGTEEGTGELREVRPARAPRTARYVRSVLRRDCAAL
jgi:hypothetical protein